MKNFLKFLTWIFTIPSRYRAMKSNWNNQSKARKILSLILFMFLLALSVAATYYTSLLINQLTIKEPGKSIIILLGVFVLGLVALILMVNFYEILIMRTMVAFACRPPKKAKQKKLETKTQELKDEKIEILEQSNVDEKIEEPKVEGPNVQEYTVGSKDDYEPTTRGFGTLFGFIYLSLIFVYTVAEFFAFFWAFSN